MSSLFIALEMDVKSRMVIMRKWNKKDLIKNPRWFELAKMVFESLVTDVLNRVLGDYVENLDSKQLKIGIWGGKLTYVSINKNYIFLPLQEM